MRPPSPADDLGNLASATIDASVQLYRDLGPGLLESAYERLLAIELRRRGLAVYHQISVDFTYAGETFRAGFRVDLLIERRLVIEVKAVDAIGPLAIRQTLTYLRLLDLPLGLVLNFGGVRFRDNIKRVVNSRACFADGSAGFPPAGRVSVAGEETAGYEGAKGN